MRPGKGGTMSTRSGSGHGRADPGLSAIMSERHQLINLAYRLLGSLADAEDAVQETYARWYAMPVQQREAIGSPGGWLTTVASRICLDLLGSARARRERYVGEWLPEPLPEDRALPGRYRRPGTRQRDDPGARGQRPARSGGSARRRHRDGARVRHRRRPDQAHLGSTQPRQAPALDGALTRVYLPSGPLPVPAAPPAPLGSLLAAEWRLVVLSGRLVILVVDER